MRGENTFMLGFHFGPDCCSTEVEKEINSNRGRNFYLIKSIENLNRKRRLLWRFPTVRELSSELPGVPRSCREVDADDDDNIGIDMTADNRLY